MSKTSELEALLYVSGEDGLNQSIAAEILKISIPAVRQQFELLSDKLSQDSDSGLQLIKLNDLYKLTTKPEVSGMVNDYFQKNQSSSLSQAALEILSIVAYRQPITRVEIDEIRGVSSSGALSTLINRGLVKEDGKKDVIGHPNIYVTTDYFLQYFGYESLDELPPIDTFSNDFDEQGRADLFKENDNYSDAASEFTN